MRPNKLIALALLVVLRCGVSAAQQRSVEVVELDGRDLPRTSHHLGISVEEVRQARELLEKATDLALRSDLGPSWPSLMQIGWRWRRVHPRKALSALEKLLDKLKSTAAETDDQATYQWCASEAQSLLRHVLGDPDRMEAFLQEWPKRKDLGGQSDPQLAELTEQIRRQRIRDAAERDPQAAAELLRSGKTEPSGDLLTEVAARLEMEGQREAAQRLLAERLAELAGAPDSPENTRQFFEFLQYLAPEHPELIVPALRVFNSRQWSPPPAMEQFGLQLENNRGSVQLGPFETAQWFLLRNLANSPQTLLEALENMPGLKAKLDRLGGFDQATTADLTAQDHEGNLRRFNMLQARRGFEQFRYRWGEADTRPSQVRKRLAALVPEGLDWPLMSVVQSHCADDPAFSKLGLELVRERFFANDDPDFSLRWLPPVLLAHTHCEGQAHRSLIEFGFRLIDRQGVEDGQPETASARKAALQNLEHSLLVAWSRLDFEAASEHVRLLDDPAEKFKVYLAMVESRAGR